MSESKQEAPKQPAQKAPEKVEAPKAPEKEAPKQPEQKSKAHPYSIAAGRSVTSKKGILTEGSEVRADWLAGGDQALQRLVSKGVVKKA